MKDLSSLPKWAKIAAPTGVLALVASLGVTSWWNDSIAPPATAANSPEVQFDIPAGSSAQSIGKELAAKKLIKSEFAWKLWTSVFSRQSKGAKSGSYQISASHSLPDVANKIWSGKVTEVSFTVPEGSNIKKMAQYFQDNKKYFTATEFIAATQNIPKDKFPWLPDGIKDLEGFLFPDTYKIPKEGITAQGVVNQMLQQFENHALPVYKEQGAKSNLSLLQWVSLSSVVEKEAVIPTERPQIAGVFVNRLSKGIKLESDPTVEYAFGIKQTPDRPLYFSEIRKPHPYNTYTTPGIPPGPIASPGLASLKAVLAPDSTDMIFFVAKYDGTHVFSKTNAEHEQATRAIRAGRQQIQKK
jgi:UPF0755 protein